MGHVVFVEKRTGRNKGKRKDSSWSESLHRSLHLVKCSFCLFEKSINNASTELVIVFIIHVQNLLKGCEFNNFAMIRKSNRAISTLWGVKG